MLRAPSRLAALALGVVLFTANMAWARDAAPALIKRVAEDVWQHVLEKTTYFQLQYGVEVTRLPSLSLADTLDDAAYYQRVLGQLEAIDESGLDEKSLITLAVVRWAARDVVDGSRFHWYASPVTPYVSPLNEANRVFSTFVFDDDSDPNRYLDLLSQYPVLVEQVHSHLRRQAARGIVLPAPELDLVVPFLRAFVASPEESRFAVAESRLDALDAEASAGFRREVGEAIAERVNPSLDRLIAYVDGPLREEAPTGVGPGQYEGGDEYYRYLVRSRVTLDIPPEEIHQIGLDAVARITAKMTEIREELGFETEAAMREFLDTDPRFYAKTPEEVREKLLAYSEGMEEVVGRYFTKRPEAVGDTQRLDPSLEGAQTYGYYEPPSATNPKGVYYFNGSNLSERSLLQAESLIYHELVPGHHFQIALQSENEELPMLRRNYYTTAFGEGWAEYSSSLGLELGRFEDPYDRYGRYASEIFFAVRLVVDTGMNALGWPLERARAYMKENMRLSDTEIATESLRYSCDMPAQALGYMMGAREIRLLRKKASDSLGDRFDIRRFHEAVIGAGGMPLEALRARIDRFIERETH